MGNKSFSHSFAAIAKFHPTLKTINEGSEEAQVKCTRLQNSINIFLKRYLEISNDFLHHEDVSTNLVT